LSDLNAKSPNPGSPAPTENGVGRAFRLVCLVAAPCLLVGGIWFLSHLVAGAQSPNILGQPRLEREAQSRLPRSSDPLWRILKTTKVREDTAHGLFTASYPPAVTALVGRRISVSGFMLPLEAKGEAHHFLLSKYTPVCFFCPPGQPNEVLEVWSPNSIAPTTDEVTVTGRFGLQKDSGMGLFFRLDDADIG